jgi:hypothetical protein
LIAVLLNGFESSKLEVSLSECHMVVFTNGNK